MFMFQYGSVNTTLDFGFWIIKDTVDAQLYPHKSHQEPVRCGEGVTVLAVSGDCVSDAGALLPLA